MFVIYSVEGCTLCQQAKEWFSSREIPFEVRDAQECAEEVKSLAVGDRLPIVIIGDTPVSGYYPYRWIRLLERQ